MQRVREFLRDILRQTDLVLLALCCTATAYGILMIYSATRYMNTLRLVLVQTGGAVVGIILFFLLSLVDISELMRKKGWLCVFQHAVDQRHQGDAVGQTDILVGAGQHRAVFHHGGGHGLGRRFQSQYFHAMPPPSTVMIRSLSFSPRAMLTMMASDGSASATFSLHSTTHTPPRSR